MRKFGAADSSSDLGARIAAVRAGTHAAPPEGPDCALFSPDSTTPLAGDTEHVFDACDQSIRLYRCEHCGQRFVYVFIRMYGEGWMGRVSDAELSAIRLDFGWAEAILLARRRRISPANGGPAYWDEDPDWWLRPRG